MISFGKNLDRYNLCSNEQEWCLWLRSDYGNLSVCFDKDDEPSIEDALLEDLLPLFEERWKQYLYRSGKDKDAEVMAKLREHQDELDLHLCRQRAERHEKQAKRWRDIEQMIVRASETVNAGEVAK